jgi:hypothetical protein
MHAFVEPPVGAHIVTPRLGYLHHGIYIGDGLVVHYGGWARGLRRAPVEEVTLDAFANGREIWVRSAAPSPFDSRAVIERARSRLGENRYRLLTNNCRHFCEWCLGAEREML